MPSIDFEPSRAISSGSHGLALQTWEQVPGCRASPAFLKLPSDFIHLPDQIHEDLQECSQTCTLESPGRVKKIPDIQAMFQIN